MTPTASLHGDAVTATWSLDAGTFAALGEPSRLRIVELLRGGPRSVGEIVDALGIRQPQVSKHLRVLSESGLVAAQPLARRRIYHLELEPFDAIAGWVGSFERLWESRLDSLGRLLNSMNDPINDMNMERNADGEESDR